MNTRTRENGRGVSETAPIEYRLSEIGEQDAYRALTRERKSRTAKRHKRYQVVFIRENER